MVNRMYFGKEDLDLMYEFIKFLNKYSYESSGDFKDYNDIHIYPEDCGAFTVEWAQVPWNHEYGGYFKFIENDEED